MHSYLKYILLTITLLTSCGFNPDDFKNIGIIPLQSKFIALPLLDGDIELIDLLNEEDRQHLHSDSIPWHLEYKSWETEYQKDTLTPLLTGSEVLNDDYFILQTGLTLPLLASYQDITINNEIVVPINTNNPFFDINILKVSKGSFHAHFENLDSNNSRLVLEVINYNENDTTIKASSAISLHPNIVTKSEVLIEDHTFAKNNGYKTALRVKNTINGNYSPFRININFSSGIEVSEVGGVHFSPYTDVNLPIPITERILDINIFNNTLNEGDVLLSDVILDIITFNTFGLDIFAGNIEAKAVSSIDGTEIPFLFTSNDLDKPTLKEERVDTLTIVKPEGIYSKKPHKIILKGNLHLKMQKDVNYYIESDSYLKHQSILKIPFVVGMNNVTFSTSLSIPKDFNEGITILDSAIFKIEFLNYFPLDGSLSLFTTEAIEDPAPYKIDLNSNENQFEFTFMKSAKLDENNLVSSPTLVKSAFRITNEDANKIINAKYLLIKGIFNTPDKKVVPFIPGQRLFIKAGMAASVNVSPDDF